MGLEIYDWVNKGKYMTNDIKFDNLQIAASKYCYWNMNELNLKYDKSHYSDFWFVLTPIAYRRFIYMPFSILFDQTIFVHWVISMQKISIIGLNKFAALYRIQDSVVNQKRARLHEHFIIQLYINKIIWI